MTPTPRPTRPVQRKGAANRALGRNGPPSGGPRPATDQIATDQTTDQTTDQHPGETPDAAAQAAAAGR